MISFLLNCSAFFWALLLHGLFFTGLINFLSRLSRQKLKHLIPGVLILISIRFRILITKKEGGFMWRIPFSASAFSRLYVLWLPSSLHILCICPNIISLRRFCVGANIPFPLSGTFPLRISCASSVDLDSLTIYTVGTVQHYNSECVRAGRLDLCLTPLFDSFGNFIEGG